MSRSRKNNFQTVRRCIDIENLFEFKPFMDESTFLHMWNIKFHHFGPHNILMYIHLPQPTLLILTSIIAKPTAEKVLGKALTFLFVSGTQHSQGSLYLGVGR